MKQGLMWMDSRPLAQAVRAAAARHLRKFGHAANACFVHPLALEAECTVDGVRVHPLPSVLRGHLWIGREEDGEHHTTESGFTNDNSP
jgi:hypothetical protein